MAEETNGRISPKEILLELVLPKLDVLDRKLDGKASAATVVALEIRVVELERRELTEETKQDYEQRLTSQKRWLIGLVVTTLGLGSGVAFNALNLYVLGH